MRTWWTTSAALLLLCVGQAGAQAPKVERDVTYGKGDDVDLKLDIATPKGKGPFPAVLCVHGGGWRAGKRQDLEQLVKLLAERGFVAATVSYRFAPKHPFPAQIEDCKAAVRWLRANADKLQIDPDRIGAVGFSAGGHLSCMLGAADAAAGLEGKGGNPDQSSRVQAVVSFFGPTDFTRKNWTAQVEGTFLVPLLGGAFEDKTEAYKKCSPLIYVTKNNPPFLFFHGTKDALVGLEHSEKMTKKLREVGVSAELVVMDGEGHGWGGDKLAKTLDQAARFFQEKLKK